MSFRKYEKIYRLGTSEAEGILKGTVYVAPKLDGTNGSVWLDFDGIQYGSRNHKLGEGADNAGFKAAYLHDDRLYDILNDHPSWRIYGEWLVPHTIKGYQDDAWRKFYVYDVHNGERFLTYDEWEYDVSSNGLEYIQHLRLDNPTMEEVEVALQMLSKKYMKDGEIGEGIVLKNYEFTNRFGVCAYAKYINEGFQSRPKKVAYDNPVEEEISSKCVTEYLVKKTADKILWASGLEEPVWDRKTMIPRLIETVYHDVITEKLYDVLKGMKSPIVNFKVLKAFVSRDVKSLGKEYF